MKYDITIEETVSQNFEVEASSYEEAREIARTKYNKSEFVLEPGFVTRKAMSVTCPGGDSPEWSEF